MLKNALSLLSLATLSLSLGACVAESDEFVDKEEGLAGETSQTLMISHRWSALQVKGGMGGNAYTPTNPVLCPMGYVATGFNLRMSPDYWVDNVQMQCTLLNYDGSFGAKGVTEAKGGSGGSPASLSCPAGQVLTGQIIGLTGENGASWTYVSKLGGFCGSVSEVLAQKRSNFGTIVGPGSDLFRSYERCPAGTAVVGFQGRSGAATDQIGFVCGEVYMPQVPWLPVQATQGQPASIYTVELNGTEFGTLNVAPGSTVHMNSAFKITRDAACPNCIVQILVGLGPNTLGVGGQSPKGCLYNSTIGAPSINSSGTISFTAPTAPGIYPIRFRTSQAYSCDLNWWTIDYTPGAAETIGFINVY